MVAHAARAEMRSRSERAAVSAVVGFWVGSDCGVTPVLESLSHHRGRLSGGGPMIIGRVRPDEGTLCERWYRGSSTRPTVGCGSAS